uniref:Uncharacterized protein n=1 Tax=Peronospora matthiolae TaxID=2874970 RepID=A0AAV1T6P7_9STRA
MMFPCALPLQFWVEAVQYTVHILNRSLMRENAKRASPLEVLTVKAQDLRSIFVFGSSCSVYRDPSRNSLQQRLQCGYVINIETPSDVQSAQLQRAIDASYRADDAAEPAQAEDAASVTRNVNWKSMMIAALERRSRSRGCDKCMGRAAP